MRIVQLIDTLEAGGAERMAVHYANALADRIAFSGLVATRKEGSLKNQLAKDTHYLFLNKKGTFDVQAVLKLRKYVVRHQVQIIQAHSSSFFTAVLLKLSLPKVKIIWHDHYGNSEFLEQRSSYGLQLAAPFFSGIIAVNEKLRLWSLRTLSCANSIYLSNFTAVDVAAAAVLQTPLQGKAGKRILCLANLRPQKNHLLLLDVASKLKESHPDWSFHLVGKDFQDAYSKKIKAGIQALGLTQHVFIYDSCADVPAILSQVQIGILTSHSEGLPLALLEYAWHQKAVLVTAVGQVDAVVQDGESGFVVAAHDAVLFYKRLVVLLEDERLRAQMAHQLQQRVEEQFSTTALLEKYICWIKTTISHE